MVVQSNKKTKFKYGIYFYVFFGYMKQIIVCMYFFFHYFNFLIELFQVKT
jgi:hypothetical protein